MLSLKNEIVRKLIHICSIIIPISYLYIDKHQLLLILIPSMTLFISLDFYRISSVGFRKLYNDYFESITRLDEKNKLTGASYVLLSSVLIILFFDKATAVGALLIMSISDSMAAIIGRNFGQVSLLNKTLEGSIAFFITSLIIILFLPELNLFVAIASIIVASIIELIEVSTVDDNISVPLSFSISYVLITQLVILLQI